MGFNKDWDTNAIKHWLQIMAVEAASPYNDGYTASSCKHELYQIKCLLEDLYQGLPTFTNEPEWEKERLVQVLKKHDIQQS